MPFSRCSGRTLTPYPYGFGVRSGAVFKAFRAETFQLYKCTVSSLQHFTASTLPIIAPVIYATSAFIPPDAVFVKPGRLCRGPGIPSAGRERFYFLPVLPKPPEDLSVSPSSVAASRSALTTGAKTI